MKKIPDNKRKFTVKLDPNLIRRIKRKSADTSQTIEVVVAEILDAYFRQSSRRSPEPLDQASA